MNWRVRSKPRASAGSTSISIASTLSPSSAKCAAERFAQIWQGIEACEAAGLTPIKINAVVTAGYNEADVVELARLTLARDWHVRFIELMPLGGGECATLSVKRYVSNIETRRRIETALGPLFELEAREFVGRSAQLRATKRPRRRRLHQPGK